LGVVTALGVGLPFLGEVMSGRFRGNMKVMANSPNELNPLGFKIVQPMPSVALDSNSAHLLGTLADSTGGRITHHAGELLHTKGGATIPIPAQGSLSTEDAIAWLNPLGDLSCMIDKNAPLQERAMQVVQFKNDLVDAMRNAMADANAAANTGIIYPSRTYDEIAEIP
jgi:hypothetical protein